MNRFILSKSSEHSWLYKGKHLKGLYGIVSDISNLGSASSNWNSCNVKDYDKNSSDPRLVLVNLTLKNNHRLVIGNLNIKSIPNKFNNLKLITQENIDILVTTETKTDWTFPLNQFVLQGYSERYRFDRNRNGGGAFTYVREDIPSRELKMHNTPEDIKSIFIEINLIKTRWLFCFQNIMINLCLLVVSTLKNENHVYHKNIWIQWIQWISLWIQFQEHSQRKRLL